MCSGMNKYDRAKEEIYNALWELCEEDDDVYQNACSGLGKESIMDEVAALAAKLDDLSQKFEREKNSSSPLPSAASTEVIYFWYDHFVLRNTGEAEKVTQAVADKDFDTFKRIRDKYEPNEQGWCYFPDVAHIWANGEYVGTVDITTPDGFSKITSEEYECG